MNEEIDGVKISQLPRATSIDANTLIPGVVNGQTVAVPGSMIESQYGGEGPAGPQGPKGDTGATGPQGPQGEKGEPGSDATVDIEQETGTSTTAVMSQKATSDALVALQTQVQSDLESYYNKTEVNEMVSATVGDIQTILESI